MTHLRHLRTGMTWRAPRTPSWKSGVCRRRSPAQKLLLTIAVLGAAASIAGLGTFATFTSSTSASHTVSSGTVTIALGATGASTNRLDVDGAQLTRSDPDRRDSEQPQFSHGGQHRPPARDAHVPERRRQLVPEQVVDDPVHVHRHAAHRDGQVVVSGTRLVADISR